MLHSRIASMLQWYCGTGCISDPVSQVLLSVVSILPYRVSFWCCITGLPQSCSNTAAQDVYLTLFCRFTSVLYQYCHTGQIFDVAQQDYVNVAVILRHRMYFYLVSQVYLSVVSMLSYRESFWCYITGLPQCCNNTAAQDLFLSCFAGLPQCCINTFTQGEFLMLHNRVTSML